MKTKDIEVEDTNSKRKHTDTKNIYDVFLPIIYTKNRISTTKVIWAKNKHIIKKGSQWKMDQVLKYKN